MRGEYLCYIDLLHRLLGSPPHARGILERFFRKGSRIGITPACAGNTIAFDKFIDTSRDHPRMRGEYPFIQQSHMSDPGSPPHARGIPRQLFIAVCIPGITPACAGNTRPYQQYASVHRDHPRMRGEYPFHTAFLQHFRDHPRMRGEYQERKRGIMMDAGSPPHARGIQNRLEDPDLFLGITPACAGNTLKIPYKYRLFLKQKPTFRLTYYRSHMLYNNPLALYAFQLHQSRKNLLLFLTGSLIDLLIFCVLMQVYLYIHSLVTVIELFYMLLE